MAFIANPAVPFSFALNKVKTGTIVQVAGRVPKNCKSFAVNLQCGSNANQRDDVALHIGPRFDGPIPKVVRNSLCNQLWGLEESFGHFPFPKAGQPFEILILCHDDRFKIAVNNQHYADFPYRLPIERVNMLTVEGDVQLGSVRVESLKWMTEENDSEREYTLTHNDSSSSSLRFDGRGADHSLSIGGMPVPGNKCPTPSPISSNGDTVKFTTSAGLDEAHPPVTVAGAGDSTPSSTFGASAGFGASRLVYPGQQQPRSAARQMSEGSGGDRLLQQLQRKHHKPTKSSRKKWSSSSSSESSSGSE